MSKETGLSGRDGASDGQVVRAILAGDTERYGELVTKYRDRYARYAARMLGSADAAEDAVQDAFVRAYDQLAQCRDPDNFVGWFFLILRNRCFAERRKSKEVAPLEAAGAVVAAERSEVPVEAAERRRALQHALLELTPEQREVFVLKHVEGLSYGEIAERLGTSVPSLKMRMHRAYDRLREQLKDFHPQVKQLLDGELTLADLPPELRAEGEEALHLLAGVDREPVALPSTLDARVLAALRARAARPSLWRRFLAPREIRVRLRPWTLVPALAGAVALVLFLSSPVRTPTASTVTVRFVLFAPEAQQVALAGTFNQWDAAATPLVRTGSPGVWSATLTLPAGQHQYAFVVDGARWVADPGAPAVDDGFGRRNSVLSL